MPVLDRFYQYQRHPVQVLVHVNVLDLGEGACADPVNGGAILGKGGLDPQGGNKERQLSPDKERDRT